MRHVAKILSVVVLAFTAAGGRAAPPSSPAGVKNIVLVHGAFADGSSWAKVVPILQAKGYHVTAVQNPLTSIADDVAATRRAIDRQDGPVVLVAHSLAGVVITEAGVDPKVAGLVFVAAFGLDAGETVADVGKAYPPPPATAAAIVDASGYMSLPEDDFVKHFAWDLPKGEARVLAAAQGPVHVSTFSTKVTNVAWKTKPSWFVVAARDEAIAPDEERFFAKRMKATTKELATSHVPMLSRPEEVAAVIVDAATKATR